MTDQKTFLEAIEEIRFNPSAMQRFMLDRLEAVHQGKFDVVDPSNPFVFLMETSAYVGAAALQQGEALLRRQYPSLAQTSEEIYLHMSDSDYVGRFASPARTTFTILLGKDELYGRAVSTGVGNIRKLVIPRHTEFSIADHQFTMQYPIEIRIMQHGGLQVVYDVEKPSPLETLTSNVVDWNMVDFNGTEFLQINVPVSQFAITPHYDQLNPSTGFDRTYPVADQFYHCRVYVRKGDGVWREIRTTHTDQVFDPLKTTALLKVLDGEIKVTIPQIYFTTGQADGDIRVDIYSTKGPVDLILSNYIIDSFLAQWRDLDDDDRGTYSAPLNVYNTIAVYSDRPVTGGTNGIDFAELRERVINNALGGINQPITGMQLESKLSDLGYGMIKSVDNITNRIFLATRSLPAPSDSEVSTTAAGFNVSTLQTTMNQLRGFDFIYDNNQRLTIPSDTLFEQKDGIIGIVDGAKVESIHQMTPEGRVTEVNSRRYFYNPFHYVLDTNDQGFEARAYHLTQPKVESKVFVQENDTTELQVSTDSYALEHTERGYKLTVVTFSGDRFKELDDDQVFAQLSFVPVGESDSVYLLGRQTEKIEGERVFEFYLDSNFDLDGEDSLYLTSFMMNSRDDTLKIPTRLLEDFDLIYAVTDYEAAGLLSSEIDRRLGRFMFDADYPIGISQERFKISLGHSLRNLWTKTRSVIGAEHYVRYETDVPWYYDTNVYRRNPATGTLDVEYDAETGEISYVLLHRAGDPVLADGRETLTVTEGNLSGLVGRYRTDTDDGWPELLEQSNLEGYLGQSITVASVRLRHRKGDVKLDGNSAPVTTGGRDILRQVDLLLIDGAYLMATDPLVMGYRKDLTESLVSWITVDMEGIGKNLLEQTKIYFYPKATIGEIPVYVEEGLETSLSSEQSLVVKFYMQRSTFDNLELREPLTSTAIQVIAESLQRQTVSVTEIASKIKAIAGDGVLSVEVSGLGGDRNLRTITRKDDGSGFTIRKKLHPLPNDTVTVQEDVSVEFVRHVDN